LTDEQTQRPSFWRLHGTLFLVQVAFATLAVEGKVVMTAPHEVPAGALAFVRVSGAALAFWLLGRGGEPGRRERGPEIRREYALLALLSILGIALNQALFLAGLKRTSPLAATALAVSIPVFSTLIEALRLGRLPSLGVFGGTALATLGVLVLSRFTWPTLGDSLVLINALAYAAYVVLARGVVRTMAVGAMMRWVFLLGALWLAPWTLPSVVAQAPGWGASTWALLAYLVCVPTVFAYAANVWALRFASPGLVTTYVYLQPVLVALWAWVRLGSAPQLRLVLATLLILVGVTGVVAFKERVASPPA
jgi:drug/metabolite transporter (DMT)-like permease